LEERPLSDPATHEDLTPEARRRRAERWRLGLQEAIENHVGPRSRAFQVIRRVMVGAYYDGFIHAGNLAYMAILALFPFFVTVTAVFTLLGEAGQREASVHAILAALPPMVSSVLEPVARGVVSARSGWLLWAGGLVGLWTVSSLIETIRDILHRAYGTPATQAFWRYRLLSSAFIFGAVVTLLFALFLQVAVTAAQEMIAAWFPRLSPDALTMATTFLLPGLVLYLSLFMLFLSLTPSAYRGKAYPKWPGALLVTLWWSGVSFVLPGLIRRFFTYDLTYGSLAGVMIALFFFWLVGLGMVIGAELNAALAESPAERDMLGQADNRERQEAQGRRSEAQ
jgi:membrane protein